MQIEKTVNEDMQRAFRVTVSAADLEGRLQARLVEMQGGLRLRGFRPGKTPLSHVRRLFGGRLMGEIVEQAVGEGTRKVLQDASLRPVRQPRVDMTADMEQVLAGGNDLVFTMAFEVSPDIKLADFSQISLERPVADITDADADEALAALARRHRSWVGRPPEEAARRGDRVIVDFTGLMDGKPFAGGSGTDVAVELGGDRLAPGFEEQLEGAAAGQTRKFALTLPREYPAQQLAGREAEFEVRIKEVAEPQETAPDDALARRLGMADLAALRQAVGEQLARDCQGLSRARLKRALLDVLDGMHRFDLPPGLVGDEFTAIWEQVKKEAQGDAAASGAPDSGTPDSGGPDSGAPDSGGPDSGTPDSGTAEPDARTREEYMSIARRRVRLGLVLAAAGEGNDIEVSDEELGRAIQERARQFPGQEEQLVQFYRKSPEALAGLRAPLFEDKVVDFILELAQVTDVPVSRAELFREGEALPAGETPPAGESPPRMKSNPE